MKKILPPIFICAALSSSSQDLIITGVIDGPLTGGTPKAIEFYATADIADLTLYSFGSANNGGGTDGPEYQLSGSALSGDFIYVASEAVEFNNFFGFSPDFTSGFSNINGDDAIELFYDATGSFLGAESVIDVFGDINAIPGAWSYMDGWAYRNNATGPDAATFTIASWTFSGENALDGESTNAGASTPFPTGSYSPLVGDFTPPVWSPSFPYLDNLTTTSFDIYGQIDEPGTIFYVVIPNDAVAPTSEQVVAGSAPGATLFSGSIAVPSGLSTVSTSVSGLVEGLDYDVYVVAQDDEGTPNVQSTPIKLNYPPELIAITEFMNNSLGSNVVSPTEGDESTNEWIELYNYGVNAVDLSGWTISDEDSNNDAMGSITISPGGYVILAKSKTFFEAQWLGSVPDARVIDVGMTLADGEDEIILSNSDGKPVWSIAYSNDETEGVATYFGYTENSSSTVFGSKASPGIVRSGNDVTGTLGYEDSGDALAYTSSNGDTGSPLDGEYAQPLPVELTHFFGYAEKSHATLVWQTATESNNYGFEIEKSIDGVYFSNISFVSGNGNSNKLVNYSFDDEFFYQSSYYRLKQVDYDGTFELSSVVFIEFDSSSEPAIWPNPVYDRVTVLFPSDYFNLQVLDLGGRMVIDEMVDKNMAEKQILALNRGTYTVVISYGDLLFSEVVIKR